MKTNFKKLLTSKHSSHLKDGDIINKTRKKFGFKKKHAGFVITLEVMLSMVMFTQFSNYTMYMMRVMNAERYISTIMTSTASQASRWGGNDTKAFRQNGGSNGATIQQIAQRQLNEQVQGFNASIVVTPNKITGDVEPNNLIKVKVDYTYPSPWQFQSKIYDQRTNSTIDAGKGITDGTRRSKEIEMNSVMGSGRLL